MKQLLTILMVSAALGASAQVPNPGFENWTQDSVLINGTWKTYGNVERSTDKHSKNYSLRLYNIDPNNDPNFENGIASNVDLTNFDGQNVPPGGQPYTQKPDSFEGWFKYDLAMGDTASIIFGFKKNGLPIAFNEVQISGNSGGNFVRLAWEVNYIFPTTPDTMVIIMFSTDPDAGANGDGYILVDDLKFFSAGGPNANIQGGGMENWVSKKYDNLEGWTNSNVFLELFGITPDTFPVKKSSVVAWGSAAFEGRNIPIGGGDLLPGAALSSSSSLDEDVPGFEVSERYLSLRGVYQYAPANGDTAYMQARMFSNGSIVGVGTFKSTATVTSYTQFSVDIIYDGGFSGTPDSALIIISSASFDSAMGLNSTIWVDDIYLSLFKTSVQKIDGNVTYTSVYPNPTVGITNIDFTLTTTEDVTVNLYDISGKLVKQLYNGMATAGKNTVEFNAGDMDAGVYFYEINSTNGTITNKIIIQ